MDISKLKFENIYEPDWREKEPSLKEVIRSRPDFPPLVILKADLQRRGAKMSKRASMAIDPQKVAANARSNNFKSVGEAPNGLLLRNIHKLI